jgi:hypothetical protein
MVHRDAALPHRLSHALFSNQPAGGQLRLNGLF